VGSWPSCSSELPIGPVSRISATLGSHFSPNICGLLKPYAVFYPPRAESVRKHAFDRHSEGQQLVAAGVAEPSEPLDPEQDDLERVRQKARERQRGRPLWDDPVNKLRVKRDRAAVVAALLKADKERRSTLRRKSALPDARKSKAQTPVALLVGAGDSRR
jgi:hypothetical protein